MHVTRVIIVQFIQVNEYIFSMFLYCYEIHNVVYSTLP